MFLFLYPSPWLVCLPVFFVPSILLCSSFYIHLLGLSAFTVFFVPSILLCSSFYIHLLGLSAFTVFFVPSILLCSSFYIHLLGLSAFQSFSFLPFFYVPLFISISLACLPSSLLCSFHSSMFLFSILSLACLPSILLCLLPVFFVTSILLWSSFLSTSSLACLPFRLLCFHCQCLNHPFTSIFFHNPSEHVPLPIAGMRLPVPRLNGHLH